MLRSNVIKAVEKLHQFANSELIPKTESTSDLLVEKKITWGNEIRQKLCKIGPNVD